MEKKRDDFFYGIVGSSSWHSSAIKLITREIALGVNGQLRNYVWEQNLDHRY